MVQLGASGILGGGTAAGVHWLRNQVRRPFRDLAEDAHETAGKFASVGEAGASAALSGTALVAPPLSALLLVGFIAVSVVTLRAVDGRRMPCERVRRGHPPWGPGLPPLQSRIELIKTLWSVLT